MSIDVQTLDSPPARRKFALPRFPSQWFVGAESTERIFGRLLWLLVPLQYWVVTHIARGLAKDDLLPSVALSLMSVAAIFILSYVIAWFASVWRGKNPDQKESLTGPVRMWVVALMINTATGYALLALSFAVAPPLARIFGYRIYGDIVTDRLAWLLDGFGVDEKMVDLIVPASSNLVYSFLAILVIAFAYHVLGRGPATETPREPGIIAVGLIAAFVMTTANLFATLV
jgi:hypothetical protein